jgi:glutamate-5-semialdehyde dehydrogenase
MMIDLQASPLETQLQQARQASLVMSQLTTEQKNTAVATLAQLITQHQANLLQANATDCDLAQAQGVAQPLQDRLALSPNKLATLVQGLHDVANLPDPTGKVLRHTLLDDGLTLKQITVPLGVVAIIFESRPDVMPQIMSLILKSGNAVVFKGGSEAAHSNAAFMRLADALSEACPFLPQGWVTLLTTREQVQALLAYPQYVDLVIPRGSNALVQHIMANTSIPVLGHADGICHVVVDDTAPLAEALAVVEDSKCQYPSACNALETLLVLADATPTFLPALAQLAERRGITLKACPTSLPYLPQAQPATDEDWRTEYGDLTLAVKVVTTLTEAMAHINTYGSHHTDALLSQNELAQQAFLQGVDSASVFINASTRFADGFRYGLGAEIGISTARTHARGPVGLEGLVSTKWLLHGHGHVAGDYAKGSKQFKHQPL